MQDLEQARKYQSATANATNDVATATLAANANAAYKGLTVSFGYDQAPAAAGTLTVKAGASAIKTVPVTAGGPFELSLAGFVTAKNEALSAELSAGGASVVGRVNLGAMLIDP